MALKGIDVSQWNGIINWQLVKNDGIDFAFLRAGFGRNNIDKTFHQNAKGANAVGIPIGLYWFSYALNVEMARQEARYCVEAAKAYKIEYPIAYDLEYDTIDYAKKKGVVIGKELATQMTIAFCEEVKKLGYTPMVYTNLDYLRRYFDRNRLPYDLWYAQYASKASIADKEIWQYSSDGKVAGINARTDMNYGYKDYTKCGTTTPNKPEVKPEKLVFNEITKLGQAHARNFAVPSLNPDGLRGNKTKEAGIKVLQHALNLEYRCGLNVDGKWGEKSDEVIKNLPVRVSVKSYLITALEILLMLKGYDPKVVQNPGTFNEDLENALKAYQKDNGMVADGIAGYKTFISLIK